MKKLTGILISLATVAVLALTSSNTFAAGVECQPIYGGGQTCIQKGKIVLNKKVANPQTGTFVDNLSNVDPKYSPTQTVTFELSVTNTGDSPLAEVEVTDILPEFITFVSGPGTFDQATKKLTFKVFNLGAGETRAFTLQGKVAEANVLPQNQTVFCVINQAQAKANDQLSQDNSQLCIERKVVPPTTKGGLPVLPVPQKQFQSPATGPEMLALFGLIPAGLGGFMLRRKTNKSFQGGDK